MPRAPRGFSTLLVGLAVACAVAAACGDPELSDEAEQTQGAGDPLATSGSPLPGIPPKIPGVLP